METTVGRVLSYVISVVAAAFTALSLAYIAHYDFGLSRQEIRTPAVVGAAVIGMVVAVDSVQQLNCDIASEEERTRISDRYDAAYSILARMLAIRRDNLRDTIAALERRLPRPDQAELVAELA